MTVIRAAPNPTFAPGKPLSYEMILCRLGGWWTMQPNESSLQPLEIAMLELATVSVSPGWFYGFNEPSDHWFGEDKVSHFGWAMAVFAHGFVHSSPVRGWVEVVLAAVLLELIEAVRYQFWAKKNFPGPWPWLTDKISPKDLAVAVLGALFMQQVVL